MINIPLEERLERMGKWFRRENERPLVGFFHGSQYPLHSFRCADKLPAGEIKPEDIPVESFLDEYDRWYEIYESQGGDLVWSAAPFWGIPWVEASLGCSVIADHQVGATHAEPPGRFRESLEIPDFSPENPWIEKMMEFVFALQERSGGRYPVGATLMRGISDLLSALYGRERFLYPMMENPAEVHRVVQRLTDYWISMGQYYLEHLPLFYGGTGAFFYAVWCPGKTIWYQEDAAALLSPGLYEQFVFPAVVRITEAFEHSVIHLHPSAFVPIPYLLKTRISVIELHRDAAGPRAEQLASRYRAVLERKPLLIWGELSESEFTFILRNLCPRGLAVILTVDTPQTSRRFWELAQPYLAETSS